MRPEKEPTNLIEKAFTNLFSEEIIKNQISLTNAEY